MGIGKLPTSLNESKPAESTAPIAATKSPSFEIPKSPVPHLDSNDDGNKAEKKDSA